MLEKTSWSAEFKSAFKNASDLFQFLNIEMPTGVLETARTYPVFIPLKLAQKIKAQGPGSPLGREFLPDYQELTSPLNEAGFNDPIGDEKFFKAPQLIHRYPTRALFTPTTVCPVHCRYCFRKNELNQKDHLFGAEFEATLSYLQNHPEISEIIFTGGDPLTLSNEKLDHYLTAFSLIPSLKDIRFHTRYPVIMPQRLDPGFKDLITQFGQKFRTLSLAVHANHVDEFDEEAIFALKGLQGLPLQLLSQTVLLKEVNNSEQALLDLMNLFLDLKIRPYYLHHPDHVRGAMHFYVSLEEGRVLYANLRRSLPGWAIPHYVVDLPGGHGKISAFNPETQSFSGAFLSQDGHSIPYIEP